MTTDNETTGSDTFEPREIIEKAQKTGLQYAEIAGEATLSGLRTACDLQADAITASRAVADATVEASRELADQWAQAVREGQASALKLIEASAKLVQRSFDTSA